MVISQGEIWWADLPEPVGSGPGYRRPVVVVQGEAFNRSRIATAVCVPLTSNLDWADAPGNVLLPARATGLPKDSVANVAQLVTLDREVLAADAELHSDREALLLEDGSKQKDLWGINFYPEVQGDGFLEYVSMINIRPSQGNRSRCVDNEGVRKKIAEIVAKKVRR